MTHKKHFSLFAQHPKIQKDNKGKLRLGKLLFIRLSPKWGTRKLLQTQRSIYIYIFHPSSNKRENENKKKRHSFPINFIFKHKRWEIEFDFVWCLFILFSISGRKIYFFPFQSKNVFLVYITMWKLTSENFGTKFIVSYPSGCVSCFFWREKKRFMERDDLHFIHRTHVNIHAHTKHILQPSVESGKQIKSHNKPFCAQSQAKKERKRVTKKFLFGKNRCEEENFSLKTTFSIAFSLEIFSSVVLWTRKRFFYDKVKSGKTQLLGVKKWRKWVEVVTLPEDYFRVLGRN